MSPVEPLWTVAETAEATGGRTRGGWVAEGVAVDSRTVVPGDLFVALRGGRSDGHRHVAEALEAGAAGALVARTPEGVGADDPRLMYVDDTQAALAALARAARRRMRGPVIAVTGSAGKTSVKEALRCALGRSGLSHASRRSFNNHVGVPLSLARMPRTARFGVFELGMNAPGEIGPLARMVGPDVAIVTTVGAAHRAAFASETEIAEAKAEIFSGLAPGGTAIVTLDHPHAGLLIDRAQAHGPRLRTVSLQAEEADIRPLRLSMQEQVSCLTVRLGDLTAAVKVGAPGRHWVLNALLVLAAVEAVGGDIALAGLALSDLAVPAGRGVRHRLPLGDGSYLLIDDAYNANPLSLAAAFETLGRCRPGPGGRRIAVLADMRELGVSSRQLHLDLAPVLGQEGVAQVLSIGGHTAAMAEAAGVPALACADVDGAFRELKRILRPGDAVLVKGANRAGLDRLVEALLAGVSPIGATAAADARKE